MLKLNSHIAKQDLPVSNLDFCLKKCFESATVMYTHSMTPAKGPQFESRRPLHLSFPRPPGPSKLQSPGPTLCHQEMGIKQEEGNIAYSLGLGLRVSQGL